MAKKYGDVVQYQMGKVTVNALVIQSNPQPDGEHLVVLFLDPAVASNSMGGSLIDKAIAKAFPPPLSGDLAYGWKEVEFPRPVPHVPGPIGPARTEKPAITSTSSFSGGHPGKANADGGDYGVGTGPAPSKVTNGL